MEFSKMELSKMEDAFLLHVVETHRVSPQTVARWRQTPSYQWPTFIHGWFTDWKAWQTAEACNAELRNRLNRAMAISKKLDLLLAERALSTRKALR